MFWRKFLLHFLVLLSAIFLSGCIDMNCIIAFSGDQSADVRMRMIFFPALYQAVMEQKPDSLKEICEGGIESDGDDKIQRLHYQEDDNDVCELRVHIASLRSIGAAAQKALKFGEIEIAPASSGFLHYTVHVNTSFGQALNDDQKTALIGHYFTIVVKAAKIIASNGPIADDDTSTTAKIPMANALTSERNKYAFEVEVQNTPGWLSPLFK